MTWYNVGILTFFRTKFDILNHFSGFTRMPRYKSLSSRQAGKNERGISKVFNTTHVKKKEIIEQYNKQTNHFGIWLKFIQAPNYCLQTWQRCIMDPIAGSTICTKQNCKNKNLIQFKIMYLYAPCAWICTEFIIWYKTYMSLQNFYSTVLSKTCRVYCEWGFLLLTTLHLDSQGFGNIRTKLSFLVKNVLVERNRTLGFSQAVLLKTTKTNYRKAVEWNTVNVYILERWIDMNLFNNFLAIWCTTISKIVISASSKGVTIACELNIDNFFVVMTNQGGWFSSIF